MVVDAATNGTNVQRNETRSLLSYDMDADPYTYPLTDPITSSSEDVSDYIKKVNEKYEEIFLAKDGKDGSSVIMDEFEAWKKKTFGEGIGKIIKKPVVDVAVSVPLLKKKKRVKISPGDILENVFDLNFNFAVGGAYGTAVVETVGANALATFMGLGEKLVKEKRKEEPAFLKKVKHPKLKMFMDKVLRDAWSGSYSGAAAGALSGTGVVGVASFFIFPPLVVLAPIGGALGGTLAGAAAGAIWGTAKGLVKGVYMLQRISKKEKIMSAKMHEEYPEEVVEELVDFFQFNDLSYKDKQRLLFALETTSERSEACAVSESSESCMIWRPESFSDVESKMEASVDAISEEGSGYFEYVKHEPKKPVISILDRMFSEREREFKTKKSWEALPKKVVSIIERKLPDVHCDIFIKDPMLGNAVKSYIKSGHKKWSTLPILQEKLLREQRIIEHEIAKLWTGPKKGMWTQEFASPPPDPLPIKSSGKRHEIPKVSLSSSMLIRKKKKKRHEIPKVSSSPMASVAPGVRHEFVAKNQHYNEYQDYDFQDYDFQDFKQPINMNSNMVCLILAIVVFLCGIMIASCCIISINALLCYVWGKRQVKINTENDIQSDSETV